jgi:hypothetical protein
VRLVKSPHCEAAIEAEPEYVPRPDVDLAGRTSRVHDALSRNPYFQGMVATEVGMLQVCRVLVGVAIVLFAGLAGWGNDLPSCDVTPDEPKAAVKELFHDPTRLSTVDGVIDSGPSYWGHSGPWVGDVDGDGRRDLVVGDFSGQFRLYRNEGTNRAPRYVRAINLRAGDTDARVPIS